MRGMRRARAFGLVAMMALAAGSAASLAGDELDVPVTVHPNEDLDTCALGEVRGLNPNGDNFLAVRSGPGTNYRMLDKLHTKDKVWVFDQKGKWFGVVYGSDNVDCSPVGGEHGYDGPGTPGWVYEKYVRIIAG